MFHKRVTHISKSAFSLNSAIDLKTLRHEFAQVGRVQIVPFIVAEGADTLCQHLLARQDWRLAVKTSAEKPVWFERSTWQAMSPTQREAVQALAAPTDRTGFRYAFEEILAVGPDLNNIESETVLGQFATFMSSDPVLDAVRTITGVTEIAAADARATCYGPGNFLTMHGDKVRGMHRRVAYVFGLTAEWRPEWGGLLLFHDVQDDVEFGLLPRMNALNLFAVPQEHSVSLVSPFAPVARYSVTGWFRATPNASFDRLKPPNPAT